MKIPEGKNHCSELLEQFSQYMEKELDRSCCEQLETHLAQCPECRDSFEKFRALLAACSDGRQEEQPAIDPSVRVRILEQLKGQQRKD